LAALPGAAAGLNGTLVPNGTLAALSGTLAVPTGVTPIAAISVSVKTMHFLTARGEQTPLRIHRDMLRQSLPAAVLVLAALGAAGAPPSNSIAGCSVIGYQSDDRLLYVPVQVNGVPLGFDIDTGARHSVIDLAAAKRLNLQILRSDQTGGAGHGTQTMLHAAPLTLKVGGAAQRIADPVVIDLSHVGTNRHIDGLLGMEFFNAYVVRIDPIAKTVAFCDPATYKNESSGASIPLVNEDNRLFINLTLTLPSGSAATHRVRVDTGSDDAVSDNLVRQSSIRQKSRQGVGIGTPYVDYSGLFAAVQIGPYRIENAWGPSNDHPAIGMEILRRFILTFDVPHRRLTLQPTPQLHDPVPSPAPNS
jgi:aspartyl protease